ncbi:MAG: isoaspartyl peptidase/L-asparaginase [Anaerolineae bacterium]
MAQPVQRRREPDERGLSRAGPAAFGRHDRVSGAGSGGDIAAATSTSGWAWKYPGRLGDTPIAGAGFYADNRYGAAACTGKGEIAIRSGLARVTVAFMQMGRTVEEAVREALSDIRYHRDQSIGITLYAIDARGNYFVGYVYDKDHPVPHYHVAVDGDERPATKPANDLGEPG